MSNLLDEWKKECHILSSDFNYKKHIILDRKDVDGVYKIFSEYFGTNYFIPNSQPNWLHFLLVNFMRPACIAAIFETANLLTYHLTLSKSIQSKFKSLLNDPHQFRNMFFELFIYRLLDYNNIQNSKKTMEGDRELEGLCTINNKEFLFECKKLYAPNIKLLEAMKFSIEKLYLKLSVLNKGFGLIGTIRFNNAENVNAKEILENKLNLFIKGFHEQQFHKIDYHHNDENGDFTVINYSDANNIEAERDMSKYHVVFKIIPPLNPTPGIINHYQIELKAGFTMPQWKVTRKLLSSIEDKRKQHSKSKYINKIYFIDSETIPDFELPIFRMDSMFEEEKIHEFINSLSENEVVCFIRREYMEDAPKILINAFGKNIDLEVKKKLENLKTNFDYKIKIKYSNPHQRLR